MNNYLLAVITLIFLSGATHIEPAEHPTRIAVRHDQNPEKYLALGKQFSMVGKVGKNGGDGTLIAHSWVITAAHVAEGMVRRTDGDFSVWFAEDTVEALVEQVILHPGFERMGPHDIALIKLKEPIQSILPANLYEKHDELYKEIVIVGHGDTKKGTGGVWVTDRKKRAATNIIDSVNVNHIAFTFDPPDDDSTTELEGTSGPGDSGGPAFILHNDEYLVAGISSLGRPGRNGPGTYGAKEYYTRVSRHLEWIQTIMENPPAEKLVNFKNGSNRVRKSQGDSGPGMAGIKRIEEWGLMLREHDGEVIMAGKMDPLVPKTINELRIRPPAKVVSIQGTRVTSLTDLEAIMSKIKKGEAYTIIFEFRENQLSAELEKK